MEKYKVIKRVILSFNTHNSQSDFYIFPDEIIESDGKSMFVEFDGKLLESITYPEPFLTNGVKMGVLEKL